MPKWRGSPWMGARTAQAEKMGETAQEHNAGVWVGVEARACGGFPVLSLSVK